MAFSVTREMIDKAIEIAFPNNEEAFGMYAEELGLMAPRCYILVCTSSQITMFYVGKVSMNFKESQTFAFKDFDKWKVKKKLIGLVLDIDYPNQGAKTRFIIRKKAGNFSDYQRLASEKLKKLYYFNNKAT